MSKLLRPVLAFASLALCLPPLAAAAPEAAPAPAPGPAAAAPEAAPAPAPGPAAAAPEAPSGDAPAPSATAEDERDRETSIASARRRVVRETPGIVTVLTHDQLLESGARNLPEVLQRVPGFQLGVDVMNAVGAGFRGMWGHEGKILYLVDGIEMNDLSYGTFLLGQRLPVAQIDRIEIIRGPGSAMYGGHAELAVVNVITRAVATSGASAALTGGAAGDVAAGDLTAAAATSAGGVRIGASASVATGVTSDRRYTDIYGGSTDLASGSRITPVTVTARATWQALDVRALYDDYQVGARDGYDAVTPALSMRFRTAAVDARAPLTFGDVTLTPQVTYRWEQPWRSLYANDTFIYDVTNERLTGKLVGVWDTMSGPSIAAGAEAYVERGRVNDFGNSGLSYGTGGASSVTYTDVAGFVEAAMDTPWANLLGGARVEDHSEFGTAFVPRFALTRVFQPFHAKLLASGAYRAPSIENINYQATKLRPERTWVYEAEVGWQLGDALYVVANAFDITIQHPIIFAFDGTNEFYVNADQTGTRGVEAELQLRRKSFSASGSWSFYTASGLNEVPQYRVDGSRALLVGFSGHKLVGSAQIHATRSVVVSPSVTFLSGRSAFTGAEAIGAPALGWVGDRTFLDLFVSWRDLGVRGLEVGIGARDLLGQGGVLVQPYPGYHAPMPTTGRELWLTARFERG